MLDMNPMAAGYGAQQPMQQGTNPLAGVGAPQKAVNMPGAIGQMINAIKGGYDQGQMNRMKAATQGMGQVPVSNIGTAGAPVIGSPDATGLASPDFPPAPQMGGSIQPPPMPVDQLGPVGPMPVSNTIPFQNIGGLPSGGMLGMLPPGMQGSLMDMFSGGGMGGGGGGGF